MEILGPDSIPSSTARRGAKTRNDWDSWLRHGKTTRLVEGEDFDCRPTSIRQQAYGQARDRGGTVEVHIGKHPILPSKQVVELTFHFDTLTLRKQERELKEAERDGVWIQTARASGFEEEEIDPMIAQARREEREDIQRRIARPIGPPALPDDWDEDIFPQGITQVKKEK